MPEPTILDRFATNRNNEVRDFTGIIQESINVLSTAFQEVIS